MLQVEQSITTPFEHLQFVVKAFDKAAVFSINKVIQDFIPPMAQGIEEVVKTSQPTLGDAFDPGSDFSLGRFWGEGLFKDGRQLFLQIISQLKLGCMAK